MYLCVVCVVSIACYPPSTNHSVGSSPSKSTSPVSNSSSLHDLTAANALWNPKPFKKPAAVANRDASPNVRHCTLITKPGLEVKILQENAKDQSTFRAVPLKMEKSQSDNNKWVNFLIISSSFLKTQLNMKS